MKKTILMAAMMLASAASFAQHKVGSLTIQPKVGINIANITDGDADSRVGLAAGAEFEYRASDMLGLSFGAIYSQQGAKASGDIDLGSGYGSTNGDATLRLDYINVPILANVYVAKGFAVKLGIQPGFKVNSSLKVKASGVTATSDVSGFKSVDFSIPVGVSYEFNNFVVDGRYNFGVTKIAEDADSKHSVFQITLGYKFDL